MPPVVASALNKLGASVSKKYSKFLNSVPPTRKRVRRKNRLFELPSLAAVALPMVSNWGCKSRPTLRVALPFLDSILSDSKVVGGGASGAIGDAAAGAGSGGGAGAGAEAGGWDATSAGAEAAAGSVVPAVASAGFAVLGSVACANADAV